MKENNYHVAWCPFCKQGWVDIIKDTINNRLLLLCNECDTLWEQPADIELNAPITSEVRIKVAEPSLDEIRKSSWDKFLIQNSPSEQSK